MCGRFNVIHDPLVKLLTQVTGSAHDWQVDTEFNVAPMAQVPVLRRDAEHGWHLSPMRWWLVPHWSPGPSGKYSMFNARAETLRKSRAFAEPLKRKRCIVPVTSYYEWTKVQGKKLPYLIAPEQAPGFAFAGLWDRWEGAGEVVESCTIITADAPEPMRWLHHRMPVQIADDEIQAWLSPEATDGEIDDLLRPRLTATLLATPVSTWVNNARNKDARCLEPLGASLSIGPDAG